MKDRIKQIMESQHMSQQVFADFIGIAPATLSGIFNERTRPTINIIEAIKKKIPSLSTDWLMFGKEPMYVVDNSSSASRGAATPSAQAAAGAAVREPLLDFEQPHSAAPSSSVRPAGSYNGVRNTRSEGELEIMKNLDKMHRRVTEIRIFYDDQTWESFVPSKK